MDKIQQEFEAWIVSALGCDVADISKDESGVYNSFQTGNLYVAWRASRAALCVEIPQPEMGRGNNITPTDVEIALDKAGVSYK